MGKIYMTACMKGGCAKTVTTYNLAYSLQKLGKKVLAVDFDSQANLTTCFGVGNPAALPVTIGHLMMSQIEDEELPAAEEYIMSRNGVDFIPSSRVLSAVDAKLRLEMGAEKMLSGILEPLRDRYDAIIIDTAPTLGALNINALASADEVIITVNPQLLAMMGLQDFLKTVKKIKSRMGLAEEELQPLVDSWRAANPNIVKFWWDVDRAVKTAVKQKKQADVNGIRFFCQSGMLFIQLPSGRRLAYVKPRMGLNRFDSESVTYEGVGGTKKWERIESYGPKFVENIVQAISRDILCYAMRTLSHCMICAHVHDELIIECREDVSLDAICEQMGRTPPWAEGLVLRADGYCTRFYKKE